MKSIRLALTGAIALATAWGCGGPPASTHAVSFTVGGAVYYGGGPANVPLSGVTVSITDIDGKTKTAVTNSSGLWAIHKVLPGPYADSFTLSGYEPVSGTFLIDAQGQNNISNSFFGLPDVIMDEPALVATIEPYGVQISDGETLTDGFGGISAVYHYPPATPVTVNFNRPIFAGSIRFSDQTGGGGGFPTTFVNTAGTTSLTISAAQIDAMNGNQGPQTDTDPFSFGEIRIQNVQTITPIHGNLQQMDATLRINVAP